ncbi:hypothetical protein [Mycobacteroides salmoniphilum]|uniref:Uncharacterized protein n=1 Tax=Mycobacteroides salmoniphilum TaxID=404941 RepID=A0A4V3I1F9_9MYCO|nr:hypothetical protein [Mycobacteroides salmoniphilum]TEA09154.1 hypothetical protein CCUG60884_00323 [Mycobacteroides salmoniphilum]
MTDEHGEQSADVPAEPVTDSRHRRRVWTAFALLFLVALAYPAGYLMRGTVDSWERKPGDAEGVSSIANVTPGREAASFDEVKAIQSTNGKRIIAAGLRMHMGRKAIVAALATSIHQTSMLNMAPSGLIQSRKYRYDYTWNRPGVGLFGQPRRDLWVQMNPTLASEAFFREIRAADDWRLMTVAQIAQYLQPSGSYEPVVGAAEDFYAQNVDEVADAVADERFDPLPESAPTRLPDDDDRYGSGAVSPYPAGKLEDSPRLPTRAAGALR